MAVILALPKATPVTLPLLLTVAAEVLFDDQVTVPVAPYGCNVAVNCKDLPTSIEAVALSKVIPVGLTGVPPPLAG